MFCRSPIITKPVSGVIRNGSSPLRCGSGSASAGTARGARSRTEAAIASMWAGVVPQHPPTMFRSPSCANAVSSSHVISGVSS